MTISYESSQIFEEPVQQQRGGKAGKVRAWQKRPASATLLKMKTTSGERRVLPSLSSKYAILQEQEQEGQQTSQELAQLLEEFLAPLLFVLDRLLDKRLVRTFVQCCVAITRFRNNKQGLLLSELGSYLDGYPRLSATATAGTKRISNLIRSLKWSIFQIDRYLLEKADKEVRRMKAKGKMILCI
jgi:hypothetical protein